MRFICLFTSNKIFMKNFNKILLALLAVLVLSCDDSDDNTNTYPTAALVSYFKFNDNLKDEMNNTPEGTNTGAAPFVTGKSGKAISLNGTNQKITFDRKVFKSGNAVSVAFWVRSQHIMGVIFALGCSDFTFASVGDQYHFSISTTTTESAFGSYTSGTWTHIAGTYDGTDIKLYINGVLTSTTNHPGTITNLNRNLYIGQNEGSSYWEGTVDELFIYGRAITQAEVTQLYNLHK